MDRPSIQRAASCGFLSIPWTKQPLSLGVGFRSTIADDKSSNPFCLADVAFDSDALAKCEIVYSHEESCRGSYTSASTTRSANSSDHLSLSLGVTVGNDVLSASVTGSYDKSVLDNRAFCKSSRRSSSSLGAIHFVRAPPLSAAAHDLLASPQGGLQAFLAKYGDFYVSAFELGADAGIMISQSSSTHMSAEKLKVEVEVQLLSWSDTETVAEKDINGITQNAFFGVTAFDTLQDSFVDIQLSDNGGLTFEDTRCLARDYTNRIEKLDQRTQESLVAWPLLRDKKKKLFWTDVQGMTESGMISRIILSPFISHREEDDMILGVGISPILVEPSNCGI